MHELELNTIHCEYMTTESDSLCTEIYLSLASVSFFVQLFLNYTRMVTVCAMC